jgi:hypothetical protein
MRAAAQLIIESYDNIQSRESAGDYWQKQFKWAKDGIRRLETELGASRAAYDTQLRGNVKLHERYREAAADAEAAEAELGDLRLDFGGLESQLVAVQNVSAYLQSWLERTLIAKGRVESAPTALDRSITKAHNERLSRLEDELGIHAFYDKGPSRLDKLERDFTSSNYRVTVHEPFNAAAKDERPADVGSASPCSNESHAMGCDLAEHPWHCPDCGGLVAPHLEDCEDGLCTGCAWHLVGGKPGA